MSIRWVRFEDGGAGSVVRSPCALALIAVDKATGERVGSLEMPGLGMYGMISYLHEGRQRIVVPISSALVALSLP